MFANQYGMSIGVGARQPLGFEGRPLYYVRYCLKTSGGPLNMISYFPSATAGPCRVLVLNRPSLTMSENGLFLVLFVLKLLIFFPSCSVQFRKPFPFAFTVLTLRLLGLFLLKMFAAGEKYALEAEMSFLSPLV